MKQKCFSLSRNKHLYLYDKQVHLHGGFAILRHQVSTAEKKEVEIKLDVTKQESTSLFFAICFF